MIRCTRSTSSTNEIASGGKSWFVAPDVGRFVDKFSLVLGTGMVEPDALASILELLFLKGSRTAGSAVAAGDAST